jgi:5-hydroxyisourate hydrolase-like protein (transthyretin family)
MKRGSKFLLISLFAVLTVATLSSSSMLLSNKLLLPTFSSSLPLLSFSPTIVQTAKADVNIDTSGNGKAAAFDGKNSISSDGKGFCNTVDNIAGGKFAPLFSGIVDCKSSNNLKQFTVDYSVIKDPVKVGDTTHMTVAVRDKDTGQPIPNVLVLLTIEPPNSNLPIGKTTTQTTYTDKDGHAIFTVHIGPRSSSGIYNTNLEIRKDNYDSKLQKAFHVV